MTLIDQFAASWVVLFLVLLEIIGFCYIYGEHNHTNKICCFFLRRQRGLNCGLLLSSRREPSYQRHRNDAGRKELRLLAVVESLLVLHQSLHHNGRHSNDELKLNVLLKKPPQQSQKSLCKFIQNDYFALLRVGTVSSR